MTKKLTLGFSILTLLNVSINIKPFLDRKIVKPNNVAYAASYDSNYQDEPYYSKVKETHLGLNVSNSLDYYRGDSVKVGIIDSGINYYHEDFLNNGKSIVQNDSKYFDYQNSGWVYYSPSSHGDTGISKLNDTFGHGSNVAATIAAQINGVGGYGIAPNIDLYVYKVTNSNNKYEFGAIQSALLDAIEMKLDIVNMSFQSYETKVSYNGFSMSASSNCSTVLSYYLNQAYNAGITLVAAAGNYNTSTPSYPASNSHVISVASCEYLNGIYSKAAYSNYGSNIDIAAPGSVYVATSGNKDAYKSTKGTSFSAPLVTGALALYKQKHPTATPAEMEQALYDNCVTVSDNTNNWAGHGVLDVASLLDIDSISIVDVPSLISVNHEIKFSTNTNKEVVWSLSDPSFGNIDSLGNFVPLKSGKIKVVATIKGTTIHDEIEINILPEIVGLKYDKEYVSLQVSDEDNVSVSYLFNDGTTYPLDLNKVVFEVDDKTICSIDANGKIKGLKKGTTTITVTDEDFLYDTSINVIVTDKVVPISSISLNETNKELYVGDSFSLTYTILPTDASNKNVVWSSLDVSVATVDNGVVTAKSVGSTTILVTTVDGNKSASCEIIVKNKDSTNYKWELVKSTDDLYDLDQIVIVSNDSNVAAGPLSGTFLSKCNDVQFSNDKTYITSLPSNALNFEIVKNGNKYALKNNGSYLNSTAVKNVSFENQITYWSVSISNGDATISNDKGKILYNSGAPRFTTYSSGTSKTMLLPQIYRYVMDEYEWSTYFINNLGCDSSGKNPPSVDGWNNSSKKYLGLSSSTQTIIKTTINDEKGNIINKASYIYDFVLNKYGTNNYSNFMNKTVNNKSVSILENNQINLVNILIISSIVLISSISLFYVYKKRED